MSSLYFDESLDLSMVAVGEEIGLVGDDARHAVTVARVRIGEELSIGDGRGRRVIGHVLSAEPRALTLGVDELIVEAASGRYLTLVQALAKGDRDELAVQAATELGVDRVVPWAAARSVSRWSEAKAARGRARWQTIVREAAKQSIRSWVPVVDEVASTKQLVARYSHERMLLLDPAASSPLSSIRLDDRPIALVVGPEGGIAREEIVRLSEAGAERVRLGASVLRTSTAGPAAIAVLNGALGRW